MISKFSNPAGSKVLHPSLAAFTILCSGASFSPVTSIFSDCYDCGSLLRVIVWTMTDVWTMRLQTATIGRRLPTQVGIITQVTWTSIIVGEWTLRTTTIGRTPSLLGVSQYLEAKGLLIRIGKSVTIGSAVKAIKRCFAAEWLVSSVIRQAARCCTQVWLRYIFRMDSPPSGRRSTPIRGRW